MAAPTSVALPQEAINDRHKHSAATLCLTGEAISKWNNYNSTNHQISTQ